MGGDYLDGLAAWALDAYLGADEAFIRPVGAASATLAVVIDKPYRPLPGGVLQHYLLDVFGRKGAGGFVTLGGLVGDYFLVWVQWA